MLITFILRARNPSSLLNGWILSIAWNNCKWVRVSTDDWVLITFGWFVVVVAAENNVARKNNKKLIRKFEIRRF